MEAAKPCARCSRNFNELTGGMCRYCVSDIDKEVHAFAHNELPGLLDALGAFDREIRRQQELGVVQPEEAPKPRRPRDLPPW